MDWGAGGGSLGIRQRHVSPNAPFKSYSQRECGTCRNGKEAQMAGNRGFGTAVYWLSLQVP